MKRLFSTRAVALAGVVLLLFAAWSIEPVLTQAQAPAKKATMEAPKAEWMAVNVVKVKPELLTEWQELQKNEIIPALKKGGVKGREAWTTGVFGEGFEYVFVSHIDKFAQYDGQNPIVKALGEEGARALGAKSRKMIVSTHTYAVQSRPELCYETKMTEPPKLLIVTDVQVARGRESDFENFIKTDWLPAVKKAQLPAYWVMQTVLGGDTNSFVTIVPLKAFADLDAGHPVERAIGEEGMKKLTQKTSAFVTRISRSIARFVPDLSFRQEPTSSPE